MAKASELSNQELVELIAKHEKVLRRLYKERDNRKIAGRDISFEKGTTSISKGFSPEFSFDLKKEGITQENILGGKEGKKNKDDHSSTYRITQLLNLSGEQLEELNRAQEKIRKEEEKIRAAKEKEKDKPKGRFG
ncbi:MAG: hypothetical protein A2381_04530 [Bdellovibrionales bacterium RIFOXYB1_FULL_37_110]|nr:MAG: hypothetical protein A2417_16110 [Bdellovibrionales bacterium RIFOXYC1_FULL_37_79]OFZ57433.1 MAG: hypothetical protein A2381_04530 [Bdellovibrionales bacterium RIFOXYB1_FULL_37_110]OFZ64525.1 MAG: hypothetical protein A2577_13635 [Bdellovibrionales bacterium RIFOXYD1_FULL_36_51]